DALPICMVVQRGVADQSPLAETRRRRERPALTEQDVDRLIAHGVYSNSSSSFDSAFFATTTAPTATAPAAAALAAFLFLDVLGCAVALAMPFLISLAARTTSSCTFLSTAAERAPSFCTLPSTVLAESSTDMAVSRSSGSFATLVAMGVTASGPLRVVILAGTALPPSGWLF